MRAQRYKCFTDGSYNTKTKEYGHGGVLLYGDEVITISGKGSNPTYSSARNIAGEIEGVIHMINLAKKKGIKALLLYHDYMGISKWITKEWKAKTPLTQMYVNFVQKSNVDIKFEHVKAHQNLKKIVKEDGPTGLRNDQAKLVYYNDLCDKLAKEACGLILSSQAAHFNK